MLPLPQFLLCHYKSTLARRLNQLFCYITQYFLDISDLFQVSFQLDSGIDKRGIRLS